MAPVFNDYWLWLLQPPSALQPTPSTEVPAAGNKGPWGDAPTPSKAILENCSDVTEGAVRSDRRLCLHNVMGQVTWWGL